jgi:hypothetical protein
MDYFKVNKYSLIEDNVLYIARNLVEIMEGSYKSFGKIVEKYQQKYSLELSINMETNIYLAMLFLYMIGKINVKDNKIGLEVNKIDIS